MHSITLQHTGMGTPRAPTVLGTWPSTTICWMTKWPLKKSWNCMRTPLVTRKMQIQTTTRHCFIPTRKARRKKTDKCWQGWEPGTLLHCWWECKMVQLLWKTIWRVLKWVKHAVAIWPSNSIPHNYTKEKWKHISTGKHVCEYSLQHSPQLPTGRNNLNVHQVMNG